MASTLNGVIVDAFNVLLDYQGTDVVNKRTSATFRAIFNPVFTDNVEAGARYLKKNYNVICRSSVDIRFGDELLADDKSYLVLPRDENYSGALSLDSVSKKIRVVEREKSDSNSDGSR